MKHSHMVVLVTTGNRREAEKIACHLLEEKLIACANIIWLLERAPHGAQSNYVYEADERHRFT